MERRVFCRPSIDLTDDHETLLRIAPDPEQVGDLVIGLTPAEADHPAVV